MKNGDGITVTWSDNSTSTIETIKGDKGEDGKNGTVVTIIDGYWAFDGVKSEYPAKGDKGDKGDQGEPGDAAAAGHDAKVNEETGYWQDNAAPPGIKIVFGSPFASVTVKL